MAKYRAGWEKQSGRAFDDINEARLWLAKKMERRAMTLRAFFKRDMLLDAALELTNLSRPLSSYQETLSGTVWWIKRISEIDNSLSREDATETRSERH